MSFRPILTNATKTTRCACIIFRQQIKTPTNRTERGTLLQPRYYHNIFNNFNYQARGNPRKMVGTTSKQFYYLTRLSKYTLCVIGAVGLVSRVKHFLSTTDWESLPKVIFRPVQAVTPNLSRHNFIADVVDKTGPAVVFLEIKGQHPESGRRITLSNGSGFLVRPNGLILTSAHVVAKRSKVVVKLHNGDIYEGLVTAVDPVYDLATVKIEPKSAMPFIPLEYSSNIRPGEFVVAMGSPLSLSNTVTSGIVSSSLRGSKELGLDNKNMQYIQTDAVISFGNSGGPLVNLDGKAIGINNLKVTSGISFAIPADYAFGFLEEAERVMDKASKSSKPSYISSGKESPKNRRFMGISMLTLTPQIISELKDRIKDSESGVYVLRVNVGSPAYDGGLHAGDIIVEINGTKIVSTADVYKCMEQEQVLTIKAVRRSYVQTIQVVTEELF